MKESGFLSGGGFGISYETRPTTTDHNRDATTQSGQSRCMVGSIDGNLSVSAGDALKISGSDLSAGQDMNLSGKSVPITAGTDDMNDKFTTKMTQSGLTLAIGGSVVNAIQTAQGMSSAASQTSNGRMKALAAAAAAMTAKDAAQDLAQNGPSARISLTVGRSESENTELSESYARREHARCRQKPHHQCERRRSGVSEGTLTVVDGESVASLDRDVITGRDTADALTKGGSGAQALDEVNAQEGSLILYSTLEQV